MCLRQVGEGSRITLKASFSAPYEANSVFVTCLYDAVLIFFYAFTIMATQKQRRKQLK